MASNRFGELFTITTWGESHGKAIGVVIDGCPAGVALDEAMINEELERRAPGRSPHTSPRKERDQAEILSGVFEGRTTGTPISIMIRNSDPDSSKYEPIKHLLRPGHGNYTYLEKYGMFDYRGGGRASARETACRVAAGAVAKQLLKMEEIFVVAYIKQIEENRVEHLPSDFHKLLHAVRSSKLSIPCAQTEDAVIATLERARAEGDSLGGLVEFQIHGAPVGLGDPIYQKLEARLAAGMMSIPASKGFEIGSGFSAVQMAGSENNDIYSRTGEEVRTESNHAGGILAGISTGMPIVGRVAFKPTSSIKKTQSTLDLKGEEAQFTLPEGSRHDPCLALRAPAIVEAMAALTVADSLLMNRSARI
jgi:chorismate synthase